MLQKQLDTINKCYIYRENKTNFDKNILDCLTYSKIIDTSSKKFDDIRYEINRRQVSKFISSMIDNSRVFLIICKKPMPRMLKVLTAKDIKNITENRNNFITYIDVTDIIEEKNGKFICENIDVLIALLFAASTNLIWHSGYFTENGNHTDLKAVAMLCYSRLFTNVINYLSKINNAPGQKNKCLYAVSLFFLSYVYKYNNLENSYNFCKSEIGISEREKEFINMYFKPDSFDSIKNFFEVLLEILKLKNLNFSEFVRTWVKLYTPGTLFGIEYFPSFSQMLTDAYVGCYLNNQSTIEKVCGNQFAEYCNILIGLGGQICKIK